MRIEELARRAGVNVETLRDYERRGLLPEPVRGPAGHRSYDEDAVRFVRAIKETQALGFTLAEIQEYLRLVKRPDGSASAAMRVRLASKIDEIDARLGSLQRVRDELARVLGCACDSLDRCTCGAAYLARRGADPDPDPGLTLHVTNGESAGNTLRQTGLGAVLPWQDVLHEGPVPDTSEARLREIRASFLSGCGWGSKRELLHSFERRDELLARALAERHVVLWFEHDLYDQLQLIQILARADETEYEPERLELIVVGSFEGRPQFHGLGELTADELATLWPVRRPAGQAEIELAAAAWSAFVAPEPTGLAALAAASDAAALPFLAPALERLLEELPDSRDGLSRTERQLLEALGDDVRSPMQLFAANSRREEAPFAGDAWIWVRLAGLGAGERPLVAVAGGGPCSAPPPRGDARAFAAAPLVLTDAGRAVLAGDADRIDLLGIDRWLGGTHLTPESLWRRDRETGTISGVRPRARGVRHRGRGLPRLD